MKHARRKPRRFSHTPPLYREAIADPDLLLAAVGKPTIEEAQRQARIDAGLPSPGYDEREAARLQRLADERYARDLARRWPEYATKS